MRSFGVIHLFDERHAKKENGIFFDTGGIDFKNRITFFGFF